MTDKKTNQKQPSERVAFIGLVVAAFLWGLSYPLTKYVEDCPTFYIISIRFAVAAVVLGLIFIKRFKNFNFEVLKCGFLLSFALTSMFIFNVVGIKYTTSVRASFFTCLSFLMVPILNNIMYKVKISKIIGISAIICLIGMFLLCYTPGMGGISLNLGDVLCILASAAGSLHIIFVEKVSKNERVDSTLFTVVLMAFISLWGTIIGLFMGDFSYQDAGSVHLIAIVLMGLLCSAVAFTLQSNFEAIVPANRVGVIFSLEPASGCILSVLLLKETMTLTSWSGAAIIMLSIFYMEYANNKQSKIKKEDI